MIIIIFPERFRTQNISKIEYAISLTNNTGLLPLSSPDISLPSTNVVVRIYLDTDQYGQGDVII